MRNETVLINKKFWEELIAYFPVIQHGPHRKPNNFLGGGTQQGYLISLKY
jgi:hypothetical protein